MTIILPALAVAFAAFCVWLAVRIFNRREKWAKRTAVGLIVGLPVLYVLSFGPACRIAAIPPIDDHFSDFNQFRWLQVYGPLIWATGRPSRVSKSLEWYATRWMPKRSCVAIPVMSKPGSWSIIERD
jgi:hypothetical protein